MLRLVNGFLALLMTVFAAVQYNDPDAVIWMVIYGVGALFAGMVAFRPRLFQTLNYLKAALFACLLLAALGSILMWPSEFRTWWDNEQVREGMGLIMVTVTLAIAALTVQVRQSVAGPAV